MNSSFTAIDFETAQGKRWSICQVGLVQVQNGIVTNKLSLLVKPPQNYFWGRFTDIHGISPEDTANAPTFDQIWHQIRPYIENQVVVAHNGFAFDFPALRETLAYYNIPEPEYEKHCTYKLFGSNLASLCQIHSIPLNHHDALSDARACAELFLLHLNK